VKAAAEQLGYVPDPGVAALARRRGGKGNRYPLVWLWERTSEPHGNDLELIMAVRAQAEARGYTLEVISIPNLGGAEASGRVLEARGVRGCFVSSLNDAAVVTEFPWDRFSVVSFLQENFELPFDTVRPDLFYLMFNAWERARLSGAQRIGVVIPSSIIARENELLLSACAYFQKDVVDGGLPPLILQPDASIAVSHYTMKTVAWFEQHRPQVVIGKTEGSYWALREAGWKCPQDFQYMTLRRTDGRGLVAGFDWELPVLAEALMARMHSLVSLGVRGRRATPGTWMSKGSWCAGASMSEDTGSTLS
jgi:DNA-binding LacI/PurR family transcriptional regulator